MEKFELPEGGVLGVTNAKDCALIVRVQTACGAVIECTLAPGSRMQLTRGSAEIDLHMEDGAPAGIALANLNGGA